MNECPKTFKISIQLFLSLQCYSWSLFSDFIAQEMNLPLFWHDSVGMKRGQNKELRATFPEHVKLEEQKLYIWYPMKNSHGFWIYEKH